MAAIPTSSRSARPASKGAETVEVLAVQPGTRLLLVGPDAVAAREILGRALVNEVKTGGTAAAKATVIETAESIFEAVLLSGQKGRTGAADRCGVIVAGVSQELEHLEDGLRHLRSVNPDARIVLLCEPPEEVICRQALQWGADDYFIVPLDIESTQKITAGGGAIQAKANQNGDDAARRDRANGASGRRADHAGGRGGTSHASPALPLNVQTELLEELLEGGLVGDVGDFVAGAVSRLDRHLGFDGRLRFEADGAEPAEDQARGSALRQHVQLGDQLPFGTLVLETGAGGAGGAATLKQAAQWLAAMLAMAQRFKQLRSLAITDELSGAYNRRYFMTYMTNLLEKAKVNRSRVTLLVFDIDDFKKYNDTFGHASGDAIIRELIKLLRACTREYDLVARIGGDEFAVVYRDNEAKRQPNSEHPKDVLVATERFREAIKNHQWPQTCNIKGEVSISGGLATFPWDADSLDSLRAKADEALLRAKAAGKNVIVMHGAGRPAAVDVEHVAED